MNNVSLAEYEEQLEATRDRRMAWWREARFGLFVHYGLYSVLGEHEWSMVYGNYPVADYERLAERFCPKPDAPREWANLAVASGMKYLVLGTRHHEGFSLWDSKANPYNSVRLGPGRDLVRETVDACRERGLRVGLYSSLLDCHHPDAWRCAMDTAARERFLAYIRELHIELLTQYGPIDILWYDAANEKPFYHAEGWNSLALNQELRALQPDIIINNRSLLAEDFGTPEEKIKPQDRDWEACMTFNDLSWGYIDSAQAAPYTLSAQQVLRKLNAVSSAGGNLLLNIGPAPDGSVPPECAAPLAQVGAWLKDNGRAVYGSKRKLNGQPLQITPHGLCGVTAEANRIYCWNWIWPSSGERWLGGYQTPLRAVRYLRDGVPVDFEQDDDRIRLYNLPPTAPDPHAGVTVMELEFEGEPVFHRASHFPQLHAGRDFSRKGNAS